MSYEHPWIFVVMAIVTIYLFVWDRVIGCLGFILLLCLVLDFHMLGKKSIQPSSTIVPWAQNNQFTLKPKRPADNTYDAPALRNIGLEEDYYPLFPERDVELQPGQPSPY